MTSGVPGEIRQMKTMKRLMGKCERYFVEGAKLVHVGQLLPIDWAKLHGVFLGLMRYRNLWHS